MIDKLQPTPYDTPGLFGIRGNGLYLKQDFIFLLRGKLYIIPAGFWFDGASIPKLFWSLIGHPMEEPFRIASLIHDYIFITWLAPFYVANIRFVDDLKISDVNWARRNAMLTVVQTAGYIAWKTEDRAELRAIKRLLDGHPYEDYISSTIKKPYYKQLMNE